jgi:hypothetical protein
MLKLCLLMAAILDGGRGHRTQFWKYTIQGPSMPCYFQIQNVLWDASFLNTNGKGQKEFPIIMSEWLLLNVSGQYFSYIVARTSYIFMRWWWCQLWDQVDWRLKPTSGQLTAQAQIRSIDGSSPDQVNWRLKPRSGRLTAQAQIR